MVPSVVQHGYYRHSDILFEWHQVIVNPAERFALKAMISSKALASPDHPLRNAENGGVDLFIGTIHTGQSRLLFSSAQVEYIRYWLHAMGLTKDFLPLPSSDYLLTKSDLRNISRATYKSEKELKDAQKAVDKNNKKLKGANTELVSLRVVFEKVRAHWNERQGAWLAIDFEAWEMDSSVLTEYGWSCVQFIDGKEKSSNGHLIVKEHMIYTNTKYVIGCRDNYSFGQSEIVTKATFKKRIQDMISELKQSGPLFLVFHNYHGDLKYLESRDVQADVDQRAFFLPDILPDEGVYIVDTSELFGALQGDVSEQCGLSRMALLLQIETKHLHNAGNDAYYTMQALRSMASGEQIDRQRTDRWPHHEKREPGEPGQGLKVKFDPWEGEDEFSDTEGVIEGIQ